MIKVKLSKYVLVLAICIVLWGCAHIRDENVIWHQHYEPVENANIIAFAGRAFEEAERLYGAPKFLVNELHIRTSFPRSSKDSIARADIKNFQKLCADIWMNKNVFPVSGIWKSFSGKTRLVVEKCAAGKKTSVSEKIILTQNLNEIMDSGQYHRKQLENIFFDSILPMPQTRRFAKEFELCETLDPAKGSFVLYTSVPEGDPTFFAQLLHEVCHLINPKIYDWYIEGLCYIFAEYILKRTNKDYGVIQKTFAPRKEKDPYAVSYFMMKDIQKVAGLNKLFRYAVYNSGNSGKMHIDINAWLNTLSPGQKKIVADIIRDHAKILEKYDWKNSFILPE